MSFKKINNITGWLVFVIATITYTLTVERTASFWDCGEFIAAAFKLQVPHPPGAPFFLLIGRMFSMLAGDVTKVAFWINMSSVLASGFTIMFLFWSITMIARKLLRVDIATKNFEEASSRPKSISDYTLGDTIKVIGAGLVGSLAYAFSDSFWFSAVEAEVYAMSSFFTAFVYWAMLKWEATEDENLAGKWILLICYMIGLSIGVHLLNLVTIPALALIIYFKTSKFSWPSLIVTLLLSLFVLYFINDLIIPGLPSVAFQFDIFFVNVIGLPFNAGIFIFLAVSIVLVALLVKYSNAGDDAKVKLILAVISGITMLYIVLRLIANLKMGIGTAAFGFILKMGLLLGFVFYIYYGKAQKLSKVVNLCVLSFIFIIIGYSSYALILIRSNFNPPLDENNPENTVSFISYLKREQYGDRPLFYGPQHTGNVIGEEKEEPLYRKAGNKYEIYDYKRKYVYQKEHMTIFPRLHSGQDNHKELYQKRVGAPQKGTKLIDEETGAEVMTYSLKQNLLFMITYQFGTQYFRYFMWNFAGREYDMQGSDWINPFRDNGKLPAYIAKNKGRNNYFWIPFIIGLLGLVYHIVEGFNKRDENTILPLVAFFVLTGVALAFYLNQPPVEPRERDYIYVGSFYVFCIWIGIGVFGVYDLLVKSISSEVLRSGLATVICLVVPGIMLARNYDDHDRSGRFQSVDSAENLLQSCAPNAILFTGGDNDTFPLWYAQDVEGIRTDVRVCNLSLLSTDWYVDQMKLKAYQSEPLPISWDSKVYSQGNNDYLRFKRDPKMSGGISLRQFIKALEIGENPSNPLYVQQFQCNILPSSTLGLDVDTAAVKAMHIIPKKLEPNLSKNMVWDIGGRTLMKADLVMLNMIATNNWKRPIYFSTTLSGENFLGLQGYLQMEGLAYRLLPVKMSGNEQGSIETDIMYNNMMTKFKFRGLNDSTRYFDENFLRFPMNARSSFIKLAEALYFEGDKERCKKVLDYCLKVMPDNAIPYDVYSPKLALLYAKLGDTKKAFEIVRTIAPRSLEAVKYLAEVNIEDYDIRTNLYMIGQCTEVFTELKSTEEAKKYEAEYMKYAALVR